MTTTSDAPSAAADPPTRALARAVAEGLLGAAPWPALLVTGDGRILCWNGPAGAALDPLAEGLEGLRLGFALADQGLDGAADLRIPVGDAEGAAGADPDAAAELVLLDVAARPDPDGLGGGLATALAEAMGRVADLVADRPGLAGAASISRAAAAILGDAAAAPEAPDGAACDPAAVLAEAAEAWRSRFAARRRRLSVDVAEDAPAAAAISSEGLSQSLGALLDLVAADPAYGDVALRAGRDADGASLRLEIAVAAAEGAPDEAPAAPGARPAAAVARDLACALARLGVAPVGGDASLAPAALGRAMTLHVRIPAGEAPGAAPEKLRPGLPELRGVSILMAEDNLTNQLVAAEMLKSMGAQVSIASDGAEALEVVARERFDLLLVDIEMPRVSGLEVIRRVRAGGGPQAGRPIVALTAYAMNEHRARIMEAGADGLIPKPILSIEELGREILGYLDRAPAPAPEPDAAAAPPPAGDAGRVVDAEIYDALVDAIGPEATEELLGKVAEDLASVRARIERAAGAGDLEELRAATHILVSVAGAIGARRLQEMAERLNRLGHDGDAAAIRAEAPSALTELDRLQDFVAEKAGALRE